LVIFLVAQYGWRASFFALAALNAFVVLPIMEMNGSELQLGELMVFAGENYILSIRKHAEHGFTDVRRRAEAEPELLRHGSAYVLYALMDTVVDRYFPVFDALDDEIVAIEKNVFADVPSRATIEAMYALKQKLLAVKHTAGPLLEATPKGAIRHLRPNADAIARMGEPARPALLLFPRFGFEQAVRPIGEAEVFVRLTQASTNYVALGEPGFNALTGFVIGTPARAIDYPDGPAGVALPDQINEERQKIRRWRLVMMSG